MTFLLLVLALQQDVEKWGAKLGDCDPKVRAEASARLIEIGEKALPHLDHLSRVKDGEVQARAKRCARQIRKLIPLRRILKIAPPAELKPDLLSRTLKQLSDHFKIRVTSALGSNPQLKSLPSKAGLFEALDSIARQLRVSYTLGSEGIEIVKGDPPATPAAYAGPFKIWPSSVRRTRFRGGKNQTSGIILELSVAHVRGLMIPGPQQLTVREIEWDTGQKQAPRADRNWGLYSVKSIIADAPREASSIRALRGVIRVEAPAEWEEWTLDSADEGSEVEVPGGKLILESVRSGSYGTTAFRTYFLVFRSKQLAMANQKASRFLATRTFSRILMSSAEGKQLVSVDDPEPSWQSWGSSAVAVEASLLQPKGATVWPTRIEVRYPTSFESSEVPFEIRDIPLP